MRSVLIDHPIVSELDDRSTEVLFEGFAQLQNGRLVCRVGYDAFVWRRLRLLESEIRFQDHDAHHKLVRFCSKELGLSVEAVVPSFSVGVSEQCLLHEVLDFLRRTDRQLCGRWIAVMPEVEWFLKARRYLNERRRWKQIEDSIRDLEAWLFPKGNR